MESFWDKLPEPFFAMAPMADVTDAAFRALVAKHGPPDVFWTEFVSADGLYHTRLKMKDEENPLMRDLAYGEGQRGLVGTQPHLDLHSRSAPCKSQRPIVMQVFSASPEMIAYGAKLAEELGFDGFDINMGCPDKTIEKQGAGAALIKNAALAAELIRVAQAATKLPVSVKTRVGYDHESLDEWLPALLETNPSAITLHLRTRKEMSAVPARWELMKKAVEIRNKINPNVLLIGNGDIRDRKDGEQKAEESGADGVMIGRGMFGNPWVFEGLRKSFIGPGFTKSEHGSKEKLEALLELAQNFEKLSPPKSFALLKKHIKAFVTGFDGAAELRSELMKAENAAELGDIIARQ